MSEISNSTVPELVIVTVTGALLVLIGVGGNVIWDGDTLIAGWPITVNPPVNVTCCESGFVIVTSYEPVAAVLAMVIPPTICIAVREVYEFTVIPVPLKERTAAGSKLLPFTVKFGMVWPWVPELGDTGGLIAGAEPVSAILVTNASGSLARDDWKTPEVAKFVELVAPATYTPVAFTAIAPAPSSPFPPRKLE